MTQLPLDYTAPRARASDPETSHAAASRLSFRSEHYELILGALGVHGEQTIHELAATTRLTAVQVARRTAELHDLQRIEPSGQTRPSPTGRPCRVWRVRA